MIKETKGVKDLVKNIATRGDLIMKLPKELQEKEKQKNLEKEKRKEKKKRDKKNRRYVASLARKNQDLLY